MKPIPDAVDAALYAVGTVLLYIVVFFGMCFLHMVSGLFGQEDDE